MAVNWEQIDPILGTMKDTDVAKKFDISVSSVFLRRKKLNIQPKNLKREFPDIFEELLPYVSVGLISRLSGFSVPAVNKIRIERFGDHKFKRENSAPERFSILCDIFPSKLVARVAGCSEDSLLRAWGGGVGCVRFEYITLMPFQPEEDLLLARYGLALCGCFMPWRTAGQLRTRRKKLNIMAMPDTRSFQQIIDEDFFN